MHSKRLKISSNLKALIQFKFIGYKNIYIKEQKLIKVILILSLTPHTERI